MGQKFWLQKNMGPKNVGKKKELAQKKLRSTNKLLVQKNYDKKSTFVSKEVVEIGLVKAEILLIWTNVTRTYMLSGQMST